MIHEKRSFEPDLPSNEFRDSHGNLACRSMLHEFERFKLPSATSQDSLAARRVNDGWLADVDMHAMSRVFASDGVAIS
jgi:hypothetical protein